MNNTSFLNLNLQINEVNNKTHTFSIQRLLYTCFNAIDYLFIKKYYLHLIKDIQLKVGINIGN